MNLKAALMLVALTGVACAGAGKVDTSPAPERSVVRVRAADSVARSYCDCARSAEGKADTPALRRIALRFADTRREAEEADREHALWRTQLEKELLRRGLVVYEEPRHDPFSLEDEPRRAEKIDAWVLVDGASLKSETAQAEVRFADGPDGLGRHEYRYYTAEIHGRFMMAPNDITGSCAVALTSFDLARETDGSEPELEIAGVCEYRYSGKLGEWVKDRWRVESGRLLPGEPGRGDDTHRTKLAGMASARFLEGLFK